MFGHWYAVYLRDKHAGATAAFWIVAPLNVLHENPASARAV